MDLLYESVPPPPVLEHERVVIEHGVKGQMQPRLTSVQLDCAWRGRFDGGARKGRAAGSYLLFDESGKLVSGESLDFGKFTNNEAEAMACVALYKQWPCMHLLGVE